MPERCIHREMNCCCCATAHALITEVSTSFGILRPSYWQQLSDNSSVSCQPHELNFNAQFGSSFTHTCVRRENHAPAGGRGVVFVGGPNSAAYARRGGPAGGRGAGAPGGGPGSSAYNILAEGAAALGTTDKPVEGPPQVLKPMHDTCFHVLMQ